jgi:hypothetical protein
MRQRLLGSDALSSGIQLSMYLKELMLPAVSVIPETSVFAIQHGVAKYF